jgi:hypothetical protein
MTRGQQMNLIFTMNFVVLWDLSPVSWQTVTYFPKAQQFSKTSVIVFRSTRLNSTDGFNFQQQSCYYLEPRKKFSEAVGLALKFAQTPVQCLQDRFK